MPNVAFIFPGQGAQSVGMGQELCSGFPPARALFDRANEILGYDLAELCFRGPEERLNSTVVSQPAIFTHSWAVLEKIRIDQPELVASCRATAGLSLGEYTSLAFAGAMSFEDTLRIVRARGEAMQAAADATPSGMSSIVGLERAQVEQLCEQTRARGRIW